MKMIVGLGNPGKPYEKTRHNIGFRVIDELADRLQAPPFQTKFKGLYTIVHKQGEKVILVQPLTYMNLSGECVRPLMDYFNIEIEDLIVLYDDLDLPLTKLRLRGRGSAGGHNGMKSLIQHLGTERFNRIRIGIDRPSNGMKIADYVLAPFTKEEEVDVERTIKRAAEACVASIDTPFLEVMNEFNQ